MALLPAACGKGSGRTPAPEPAFEPGVYAGPVLGSPSPTEMTVQWALETPGPSAVEVRPLGGTFRTVPSSTAGSRHAVELGPLQPGTRYEYRLVIDGAPSVLHSFRTPPGDPTASFRYIVMGDMGTGASEQLTLIEQVEALDPDVILLAGDVAYDAGTATDVRLRLLSPWARTLARYPVYIALGNHDAATNKGQPLYDAMPLPTNDEEGTKNYFRVDYGCCTFLCLDSMLGLEDATSPQLVWLNRQLQSPRRAWTVGMAHHPVYTRGGHSNDAGLNQFVVPLLEQYDVPLFFSGHDHNYQRAHPRRRGVATPVLGDTIDGPPAPIYIVTGGGGRGLYDVKDLDGLAVGLRAFHLTVMDVSPTATRVRAIGLAGETLDDVTIRKVP